MEPKRWAHECENLSLGTVVSLLFALLMGLSACSGGNGLATVTDGGAKWDGGVTGTLCGVLIDAGPSVLVYNSATTECSNYMCIKAFGTTNGYCAGDCTQDSDCVGLTADPNDPLDLHCRSGFSCVIPMSKGFQCCRKLCLCTDFVTATQLQTPGACVGDAAATCS
jgi:hypothetical protein